MKTITVLFFLFSSTFNLLWGCSCSGLMPGAAYNKAATIIYGKVIEKKLVSLKSTIQPVMFDSIFNQLSFQNIDKPDYFNYESTIQVKVEVYDQYKELSQADTLLVYTMKTGASCGYTQFEVNKEFIIYGYRENLMLKYSSEQLKGTDTSFENRYWTHQCTRTNPATQKELEMIQTMANPRFYKVVLKIALNILTSRALIPVTNISTN